jgi:transcriptional/translational regulatory protein YebC/TACO1
VAFQFRKMGVFRLKPDGIDHDDLELYLIDHGLDEMGDSVGEKGEPQIVARCLFPDFGQMQEALEKRGIHPISAAHEFICTTPIELPEAQATEVLEMVDLLEQNDDVQHVYHSLI